MITALGMVFACHLVAEQAIIAPGVEPLGCGVTRLDLEVEDLDRGVAPFDRGVEPLDYGVLVPVFVQAIAAARDIAAAVAAA